MMLLLVILLGIYLIELRTENVYGVLSSPLFTKEVFYDVGFSDFIRNIFEIAKNGEHLFALKYPLFRKEGAGGDLTIPIYPKSIPLILLCKRTFYMLILLGIYLRRAKNGGHLFAIKIPPLL